MKKEIKGFICGIIVTSLIGCVSISATGVWDKIDVLRNDINVVVNGTPVKADNFLYNDTTYLPMRVVAEALGKDVQYDETTNTATIKDKGDNNLNGTNVKPASSYVSDINGQYYIVLHSIKDILNQTQPYDEISKEAIFVSQDNELIRLPYIIYNEAMYILYDDFINKVFPYLSPENQAQARTLLSL